MQIYMEPTDTEKNIEAIKGAISRKMDEVDTQSRKLADLKAELRGLYIALEALGGSISK